MHVCAWAFGVECFWTAFPHGAYTLISSSLMTQEDGGSKG